MAIRLLCLDMDGVLVDMRNSWMIVHQALGTVEEGTRLTKKYLYVDYDALVKEVVVGLWKGKDASAYMQFVDSATYITGIEELFSFVKKHDIITAIVSAGNMHVARKVANDFGVEHVYANELVIENGVVTGEFINPVKQGLEEKARIVRHLCQDLGIDKKDVVFVGDSEGDVDAFAEVGMSIAFNDAPKEVQKMATHVVMEKDLEKVVDLLEKVI